MKPKILLIYVLLSSSVKSRSTVSPINSPTPNNLFQEVINNITYSRGSIINLVKCCPLNHLYKTGLNYCRPSGRNDSSWDRALLPVHSITTNKTLFYTDLTLNKKINSILCPEGFLGKTSTKFNFYEDGTLKLDLDGMSFDFLSDEFCIDQTSLSSDDRLIARFCIPSKCDDYESLGGIHCIRKCCPLGSVVNRTTRNCQKDSSYSSFNNDVNHQLREYRTGRLVHIDDFTMADGVAPHCLNNGRQGFKVSQFYLLKDGRMYNPNFPCQSERATKEYCIDHFIYDEQGTIQLEGIRCFTNVFTSTDDDSMRSLQIYPYFLLVSAFFLIATIAVYIAIPEIRDNIHGVSTMFYFACTALFYVLLAMIKLGVGIDQEEYETNSWCRPLAICAHFYFLSTFTWLNVVDFDLWWTFKTLGPIINGKNRSKFGWRFVIYSIYAWGIPLTIVLVGQVLDLIEIGDDDETVQPKFGFLKCWFMCKESFLVYLYVPVAVLILFNVIFFFLAAALFHRTRTEAEFAVGSRNAKQRYRVIFNLFILMGISWSTEVVSFILDGSFYSWFLTDLINSLMGFIIFVIFICKARIGRLLLQNCPWLKKLFSLFELLVRGKTAHGPPTATGVSVLQTLIRINSDESSRSNIMRQSIIMIPSSFKIIRNRGRTVSPPMGTDEANSHNVICVTRNGRIESITSL